MSGVFQDWEFLVSSAYHAEFMSESRPSAPGPAPSDVRVDPSAPLFPHMASLLFVLHLVYEVRQGRGRRMMRLDGDEGVRWRWMVCGIASPAPATLTTETAGGRGSVA